MKKQCGNCRYFSEYYVKLNQKFMAACIGQCMLKRVDRNKCSPLNSACDKWETVEIQISERKKAISEAIINISDRLDKIAEVLTNNEYT